MLSPLRIGVSDHLPLRFSFDTDGAIVSSAGMLTRLSEPLWRAHGSAHHDQ